MEPLKRPLLLVILTLFIAAPIAWFLVSRDKEPVPFGFVGGLTGKAADLGIDCRRGTELAVRWVNEHGGIDGRPINLIVKDDAHDPEQARTAVTALIESELPVIIGHTTSAMTMATLPIINASDTLLVSPTTSTPLLSDLDDNLIRSCTVSTTAATTTARYILERTRLRQAGVIYDLGNKAYTEQWLEAFSTAFLTGGGAQVFSFPFTSGSDITFLPLVEQMQLHDLDILVVVANSVDAAMFSQQVRKTGWSIQLALSDWSATEQLLSLGGDAVEGAVISQFFNRMSNKPAFRSFKTDFERYYKSEPGFGALHAYNATMLVVTAMRDRHPEETLKEAILRISHFNGLQDDIDINRFGDAHHPTYMGVIKEGRFVIIEDFR